jgi:hypothetical protein
MYPEEIRKFLVERNYIIGGDDLELITSIISNPQLDHITYDCFTNKYKMWDKFGNYYEFEAMLLEEAKDKGLVKCKKNKNLSKQKIE